MNGFETTFDKYGADVVNASYIEGTLTEYIDDELVKVGLYGLAYNKSLSIVSLPNVSYLGSGAFYGCTSLKDVNLPRLDNLGNYSIFAGCSALSNIDFLSQFKGSIGSYCFMNCGGLVNLTIPSMISCINAAGFAKCSNLQNVIGNDILTSLYSSCFSGCVALETVSFPAATNIASNAFSGCSRLKYVNIPSARWIGDHAFDGCTELEEISIYYASSISGTAFGSCSKLSRIYVRSDACILGTSYAFNSTKITFATGSIYVPSSRVDYYRQSTNWNWFSTQIFGYDYENDRPVD